MSATFAQYAAQFVGPALSDFGMYEAERALDEVRYRSSKVDDLIVLLRKDFVHEISLVVWFPSRRISYTAMEVAHWAGVSLPSMIASDQKTERVIMRWIGDFVRAHYGPLLSGDSSTLLTLDRSISELGKAVTNESNRRSAESAARIAAQYGDVEAVIKYLTPFSNEIDEEYQALLSDAKQRSRSRKKSS